MRWPFVHRARLEAAEYRCQIATAWANTAVKTNNDNVVRHDADFNLLLDHILALKQQGFVAIPPKRAPKPDYLDTEPAQPDPFIETLKREGVPEHLARQAQLEAIEAFESGDA